MQGLNKLKERISRLSECWRRTREWLFSIPFGSQLGRCYLQAVLILGDDCILTSDFRSDCRRSPRVCLDSLPCILGPLTVSGRLLSERYDTRCWAFLLLRRIHSQGAFVTPSPGQLCWRSAPQQRLSHHAIRCPPMSSFWSLRLFQLLFYRWLKLIKWFSPLEGRV